MNDASGKNSNAEDTEMIYGLTLDERDKLRTALSALPDTMPPRPVWRRISEQAEAEGLLRSRHSSRRGTWYAGAGLAAAALLVAILSPMLLEQEPERFSTVPDNTVVTNAAPVNALETLMVESRQLENDLRALPDRPRVVRAGTQATLLELEDRIAAIDYQLSGQQVRLTEEEREIFWRERVRLMKSLLRLRYAETQRATF